MAVGVTVGLSGHAMTVSLAGLAKTIASSGILGTLGVDVCTAMEQMQSHGERGLFPVTFLQRQQVAKLTAQSSTILRELDCVSIVNPGRSMKRESQLYLSYPVNMPLT